MYRDILQKIEVKMKKFGYEPSKPSTNPDIENLKKRIQSELQLSLPIDYENFLMDKNGLTWNGAMFYSSIDMPKDWNKWYKTWGLVDANLLLERNLFKERLVLGESGIDFYVYDFSLSLYLILDRPSLRVMEKFESFDEFITNILNILL